MLGLSVKFSDDPKFTNLEHTFRCLGYTFIHHLDIWTTLATKASKITSMLDDTTASQYFTYLMKSGDDWNNRGNIQEEITDVQLSIIANTFIDAVKKSPLLSRYIDPTADLIVQMFDFCQYLFIPVRLDIGTVPQDVKIASLRKYLSTVFSLPFDKGFLTNYSTIPNISKVSEGISRLLESTERMASIMNQITAEWCASIMSETFNKTVLMQNFLRGFMNVVLLESIDIMKKYNPCIKEASLANPAYDGKWIVSFGDDMILKQIGKLNSITKYVSIEN